MNEKIPDKLTEEPHRFSSNGVQIQTCVVCGMGRNQPCHDKPVRDLDWTRILSVK